MITQMLVHRPFLISLVTLLLLPAAALAGPIDTWCEHLGKRLNSVSVDSCRTRNFVAARDLTPKGNLLVFRDIAPASPGKRVPQARRILVVGGIHGDELTSISTVFRWLD